MEATIFYQGILAEKAGKETEPLTGAVSLSEVREWLAGKYDGFREMNYAISLNGRIVHEDAGIGDGDQIYLIPPFPGG
jgi:molybdopterin converting factor small subunit